jgi:hypothetical protein
VAKVGSGYEDAMTAAIEPWFGEDARTVAILLPVIEAPEARAMLVREFPDALLAAINEVERTHRAAVLEALSSPETPGDERA